MTGDYRTDEGEWALNNVQGPRRYMVKTGIVVEVNQEHRTSLQNDILSRRLESNFEIFSKSPDRGATVLDLRFLD
jgi:hypothetical protein